MKKESLRIIEWCSYFALLLLYEFLYVKFVRGGAIGLDGLAFFVGGAIGNAVIPLAISFIILLIKKRKIKTDTYHLFTRIVWISTTIILLIINLKFSSNDNKGYGDFLCVIPLALGALYWVRKHEPREPEDSQNHIDLTNSNSSDSE